MSDYVEELVKEQRNSNGLLMQVLTSGYDQYHYVFALEGVTDRKFYYDFLKNIVAEKNMLILDCGGKRSLLNLKDAVEAYDWVDQPQFRYICDKDFDDYLGLHHPGVWKTKWYAIESYITVADYIEYNVEKFSSGGLTPADRRTFVDRYEECFLGMAKVVRPYCAFICEVRANGEHPSFDDVGIDALFRVGEANMPRRVGVLQAAIAVLNVEKPVSRSRILNRAKSFSLDEVQRWLRGKLALQIARKAYEKSVLALSTPKQKAIPAATFLAGDSLSSAFPFLKELDGLRDYCES